MSFEDSLPAPLHVYEREIGSSERTSLSMLAARIAPGARVLDLGCGSGAVGRFLAQRDGRAASIDGLTINQAEAERARAHYRRVEVADLDQADLMQLFEHGAYDVIVCADVLEHLRQSPRVLRACRDLLAPDGVALLSIPNAGYCGLVAELMAGEFRYREEGLLDTTHVRFFTRATLLRFLAENGWRAERLDTIERELPDSEFHVAFDALPPAVARYLLALSDALTYQFIVTARPDAAVAGVAPPADQVLAQTAQPLPVRALFSTELFLGADGGYDEARKLTARGEIGRERQTLRFDLPAASLSGLKLDLADRPGFIHLHGLTLTGDAGQALWRWTPGDAAALVSARHQDLIWAPPVFESRDFVALLYGDDPWVELPISPQALAQAAGGALTVELGWPMSADYLALVSLTRARVIQAEGEQAQTVEQLQETAQNLRQQVRSLTSVQEQNEQLRQQRLELIARTRELSRERDEARALVRAIETSKMFRLTRPIVHAKVRVQRLLGKKARVEPVGVTEPAPQPLAPPAMPVDLIVPVYRGLEDTRRCVESVLHAACQTPWRLVLINDASPEPDLTGWLRQVAAADPRITLLENEQNLGFVGTVNRGMALAREHDVLLLNSDTEVAGDWLDRLRAAAYSDQQVATVTPFSNNATICSYPRFCQDNELPAGWDTARLDALFARVNAGQVTDVPTGVGFCLYIRRAALDMVGLFDAEHFGKGYGEENDFCVRAEQAGWRNLHALDTFVQHFGGVSFGASKEPRERAAMRTLRRLHPQYENEVQQFIKADPARLARHAVDVARLLDGSGKPVILAVLHDRLGGTERHVLELARALQDKAHILTLKPALDNGVSLRLADANEAFELCFALGYRAHDLPSETGIRDEYGDGYAALLATLRALGVCHIHYHHRIGHGRAILDLARRLGVGYDFTAHDYYAICPQITLTNGSQGYCGEAGEAQCAVCLAESPVPGHAAIAPWRQENAGFLNRARFVIAPSRDASVRLLRYMPAAPLRLVPHTDIDPQTALPAPQPPKLEGDRPLKVAVLGALSVTKGANVLADAAVIAKTTGAPVEFHLIGYSYRTLKTEPHAHLTVYGRYDDADLPQLLAWLQPDVVWFPALWPETYCYTLSACLQGGWPVAASAIGAFTERLAGRRWTWLKSWQTSAAEWVDFFADIRARNYCTGQPPAPPMPVLPELPASALPDVPSHDWYAGPYLAELPQTSPARELTPELRALIAAHLTGSQDTGVAQSARGFTLRTLARARAHPLLTGVACAIPQHWRTRVKSWLLK
ncbi:MAG: methyltransferase domain-containing protein [Burkholderiaceae bacterium]|jgi:GT2 family glycosyltransferase/2-polyprenyl-3-methyl-5-hydroxy-6-metoxy-1,4-benzoquinol methylase/glycosyltransferase involved in cell wall biosynthesis|nr:methyltransferase domain-containing protein [Burkholderiaceae bacterium]